TGSTSSTATQALSYTYNPSTASGSTSTTVSIAFSNGSSAGTNASQTVATTLIGHSVGPQYSSTVAGQSTANTPTPG
ncbi:MAG TPA: hypothetical protein VFG12_03040, partial [Rhodopila sp.]|nr:hypothetical protein [Rhodopila sp.]